MTDPQTSPITREALDEFIRQLFVVHWVLGQMIAGMLERARREPPDWDPEASGTDTYSMTRRAIGEVVDRHGPGQIDAATKLIDEVMDAISDDRRIFPREPAVTTVFSDPDSRRLPARRRRY